jgi:hypothetical protein
MIRSRVGDMESICVELVARLVSRIEIDNAPGWSNDNARGLSNEMPEGWQLPTLSKGLLPLKGDASPHTVEEPGSRQL